MTIRIWGCPMWKSNFFQKEGFFARMRDILCFKKKTNACISMAHRMVQFSQTIFILVSGLPLFHVFVNLCNKQLKKTLEQVDMCMLIIKSIYIIQVAFL